MKSMLVVALGLSFACASTLASSSPAGAARSDSCAPTMADKGAIVYSGPDSTSNPVATFSEQTQVCADQASVGFGYRHVKLGNGKEGYVAETSLSI